MTDKVTQDSPDALPERLAAAAGAGELAAAAAIDAEEGDKFLQALLADQMAAAHLLTMRMAAAADRAIGTAADGVGQGEGNLPLFDLAAARFAGAAARLNGRYCRGLQTLRALAGPAAADEEIEWVGFNPPGNGEYELLPEEKARRINREIFYRKLNQTWPESDRESSARRRALDATEQARLAAAGSAARDLLAATGVETLAGPSNAQQTRLFTHQLAAAHRLMMRLSGRTDAVVTAAADPLDRPEGLRLAHGAARLMERFRQGVAMLQRFRTGPDAPRRIENYFSGPISDDEREEERQDDISHGLDPETGLPAEAPLGAKADLSAALLRRSPQGAGGSPLGEGARSGKGGLARRSLGEGAGLLRRGRLNNGNPGGDFLAAPRCGARTRAGCACHQPAMANGRCRFHGGKSTGPRTEAGRERARSNRLVHGLRSAEVIALSAAAAAVHRRLGVLLGASAKRIHHRVHRDHGEGSPSLARAARNHPSSSSVLSVSSVVNPIPSPAGHEVDRSDSVNRKDAKTQSNRAAPSSFASSRLCGESSAAGRPIPAGHGVDRSESNTAARTATILPFARPTPARSPCGNRLTRVRS